MHEQVLAHAEVPDLPPAEDPSLGEGEAVVDDVARPVLDMLVDVVRDDQIDTIPELDEAPQLGEQGLERGGVDPVVGVDVLEVDALGVLERLHDRDPMAPVLLMDGLDDRGMALLPRPCAGKRVILCGPVVHDDDLHVLGEVTALKDRLDAVVHVSRRVVARNRKGDGLLHCLVLPLRRRGA